MALNVLAIAERNPFAVVVVVVEEKKTEKTHSAVVRTVQSNAIPYAQHTIADPMVFNECLRLGNIQFWTIASQLDFERLYALQSPKERSKKKIKKKK